MNEVSLSLVSSYVCSNSPTISAMIEIKAQFFFLEKDKYKFRMRTFTIFTGLLIFVYNF